MNLSPLGESLEPVSRLMFNPDQQKFDLRFWRDGELHEPCRCPRQGSGRRVGYAVLCDAPVAMFRAVRLVGLLGLEVPLRMSP